MIALPSPLALASRACPAAPASIGRPHGDSSAQDVRWPALVHALESLREMRRHSIRIVDADCGAGCLLLHAARHARAIGFTAIEGRGVDGVPQRIGRARAAAARLRDPAIGLHFEVEDVRTALEQEAAFPADILLWRRPDTEQGLEMSDALHAAARLVLIDERTGPSHAERRG